MKRRITILKLLSGIFSLTLLFSCSKEQKQKPKPEPEVCRYENFKYFYTTIIDPQENALDLRLDGTYIHQKLSDDRIPIAIMFTSKKCQEYNYDSKDEQNKAMFYKYADAWGDGNWNSRELEWYHNSTILSPITKVELIALTDFDEKHKAGSNLNEFVDFYYQTAEKYFLENVVNKKENTEEKETLESFATPLSKISAIHFLSITGSRKGRKEHYYIIGYLSLKKPKERASQRIMVKVHFPNKTLEAEVSLAE